MTKSFHFFAMFVVLVLLSGSVFAPHDQGQGRSQDHPVNHTDSTSSVSTAAEPVSGLLFLVGGGLVAMKLRRKSDSTK